MFNNKLFLFTIFLLVREVTEKNIEGELCQDWYLRFPTKYQCLEYYKNHRTTGITTTSTTTATTTSTTTTTTSTTSSIVSTSTWSPGDDFFTTVSPPIMTSPQTKPTTTQQTTKSQTTETLASTTTSSATNSARNKRPWFLSLWAIVFYR